jgi:hypothetical protein
MLQVVSSISILFVVVSTVGMTLNTMQYFQHQVVNQHIKEYFQHQVLYQSLKEVTLINFAVCLAVLPNSVAEPEPLP